MRLQESLPSFELRWWKGSGIVADVAKEKNDPVIKVLCPELTPLISGEITPNPFEMSINKLTGIDPETPVTPSVIKLTSCLTCYYLGDPQSMDVPDVAFGERVFVLNFKGDDKYWWIPYHSDSFLRRNEHIRIKAMNKRHSNIPTEEEVYEIEVDTKYNKHILLRTTKGDGEAFAYTIKIDAVSNTVSIMDDIGNSIIIDSNKPSITLLNSDKTQVKLEKADILMEALGSITMRAREIIQDTPTVSSTGIVNISGNTTIGGDVVMGSNLVVAGNASFSEHSGGSHH